MLQRGGGYFFKDGAHAFGVGTVLPPKRFQFIAIFRASVAGAPSEFAFFFLFIGNGVTLLVCLNLDAVLYSA